MTGVKFVGNPEDHTGYGRACLNTILALLKTKIPITLCNIRFIHNTKQPLPPEIKARIDVKIPYDTVIVQCTPSSSVQFFEPGKKNIIYFFWETDCIPSVWVDACNSAQEIWVACQSNKDACIKSGVTTPIRIVPQAMSLHTHSQRLYLPGVTPNTYVFYNIFQWTPRKNPRAMLHAYWKAFTAMDDVLLVVKTYGSSDNNQDVERIKSEIKNYKAELQLSSFPRLWFIHKIISDFTIESLHNTAHCFVSSSKGEGWNMSLATSAMLNKPIISSTYGGLVDFMSPEDYYSVDSSKWESVSGMSWIQWYEKTQKWTDPNIEDLSLKMRQVFDENVRHVEYEIAKNITLEAVGAQMRELLWK